MAPKRKPPYKPYVSPKKRRPFPKSSVAWAIRDSPPPPPGPSNSFNSVNLAYIQWIQAEKMMKIHNVPDDIIRFIKRYW